MGRLFLILLAIGCSGCAERATVSYRAGGRAKVVAAPREGQYELYPSGSRIPEFGVVVLKGQPVGFRLGADGSLIAVAGPYQQPLSRRDYRFVYLTPESSPNIPNMSEFLTGAALGSRAALPPDSNDLRVRAPRQSPLFDDDD